MLTGEELDDTVDRPAHYRALVEEVLNLADMSGGWDEKAECFRPDVQKKINQIDDALCEALGLTKEGT